MEKWVMVVWLSGGMYLPVTAFDTEDDCYAAIQYIEPPMQVTCVKGIVEPERKSRKRGKHS